MALETLSLVASVLLSYLAASTWEMWAHKNILHANHSHWSRWRRWGILGALLRRVRFNHHTVHHRIARYRDLSEITKEAIPKMRFGNLLSRESLKRLEANQYDTSIEFSAEGLLLFSAVPVAVSLGLFLSLEPLWSPLGIAIGVFPFMLTKYVHPWLHRSSKLNASSKNCWLISYIIRKPLMYLHEYHLYHHINPTQNFNLLPGADFLFGLARRQG
jgi:hypothetical protein